MRSFREIVDGEHDDIPERAFYMKGTIDEVLEDVKGSGKKKDQPKAEDEEESSDEEEDTTSDERPAASDDESDEDEEK